MPATVRKSPSLKNVASMLGQAFHAWSDDTVTRLGAALAFYTTFSIAPFLVLIVAFGSFVLDQSRAESQVMNQIANLIGTNAASALQSLMQAARKPTQGVFATVIGFVTLIVGATGALLELQDGLNQIWKIKEDGGFMRLIRKRLSAILFVLLLAAVILFMLMTSAVISVWLSDIKRDQWILQTIWQMFDFFVSWGLITLVFAVLYKLLPRTRIAWSDVWLGSGVAGLLFTFGKFLVGLYLSRSAVTSAYGAAGSLVVILLWVYYSSLMLYYGAEFSKVYARSYGSQAQE